MASLGKKIRNTISRHQPGIKSQQAAYKETRKNMNDVLEFARGRLSSVGCQDFNDVIQEFHLIKNTDNGRKDHDRIMELFEKIAIPTIVMANHQEELDSSAEELFSLGKDLIHDIVADLPEIPAASDKPTTDPEQQNEALAEVQHLLKCAKVNDLELKAAKYVRKWNKIEASSIMAITIAVMSKKRIKQNLAEKMAMRVWKRAVKEGKRLNKSDDIDAMIHLIVKRIKKEVKRREEFI
jgi:hypothetical protein